MSDGPREDGMRQFTCIIRERQLRIYGHVARLLAQDPAHRILSSQDPCGWSMPLGCPLLSWLRQVEFNLKDMSITDSASAWQSLDVGRWSTVARWTRRRRFSA